MDLYKVGLVLYSAESSKFASAVVEILKPSLGTCIYIWGSVLRIDCVFYNYSHLTTDEQVYICACGLLGDRSGGEDDGACIYMPYGQIPSEILDAFIEDHKKDLRVRCADQVEWFLRSPVVMQVTQQFSEDVFVTPVVTA